VQRFRGRLVFKAHRLCVSLNSRHEINKEEEESRAQGSGSWVSDSRFRVSVSNFRFQEEDCAMRWQSSFGFRVETVVVTVSGFAWTFRVSCDRNRGCNGFGFRVAVCSLAADGFGFRVQVPGTVEFRGSCLGFLVPCFRIRVPCLGTRVPGFGYRTTTSQKCKVAPRLARI